MQYVKMLCDVAEGIRAHEDAVKVTGAFGLQSPPIKFYKDEVVRMTEGSADKFVDRKLGELVDQPAQVREVAQDKAERRADAKFAVAERERLAALNAEKVVE